MSEAGGHMYLETDMILVVCVEELAGRLEIHQFFMSYLKCIWNRPSMSMACPDDLEHKAPDVSMKKTFESQVRKAFL